MIRAMLLRFALVLFTICLTVELEAQAQGQARTRRVPLTIVLTEALPAGERTFVVQRRPEVRPHDVIYLHPDATEEHLSEAIRTLLTARQASGDFPVERATVRVRPHQSNAQAPRRPFPWVARVLADLRTAPLQDVAGVGRVRAVQIYLPPQRGRTANPAERA